MAPKDKAGNDVRARWSKAQAAYDMGDFFTAGRIAADIETTATDTDLGIKAAQLHTSLTVDPTAWQLGALFIVVYFVSWFLAL